MKPFIPREWMRMRKQPHPTAILDHVDQFGTAVFTDGKCVYAPYSPGEVCWARETYRAWFPCDADGQPIDDHWHVRYKDGTERITGAGWDEGPDYLAPDDVGLDKEPVKWRSPATMPQWAARRHVRILSCVPEHRGEWGWRMEWEESNAL